MSNFQVLKKSHLLNRISVLNELKSAAENLVSSCYNEPKPNIRVSKQVSL